MPRLAVFPPPISCYCNSRRVGQALPEYTRRVRLGEEPSVVLDSLRIDSLCCRVRMLTHKPTRLLRHDDTELGVTSIGPKKGTKRRVTTS